MLKVVSKRWGEAELAMDDGVAGTTEWPEATRRIGSGEGVSPSPVGVGSKEGAVPPPQKFFLNFAPGNGAFWCTFYAIFYSQLA